MAAQPKLILREALPTRVALELEASEVAVVLFGGGLHTRMHGGRRRRRVRAKGRRRCLRLLLLWQRRRGRHFRLLLLGPQCLAHCLVAKRLELLQR